MILFPGIKESLSILITDRRPHTLLKVQFYSNQCDLILDTKKTLMQVAYPNQGFWFVYGVSPPKSSYVLHSTIYHTLIAEQQTEILIMYTMSIKQNPCLRKRPSTAFSSSQYCPPLVTQTNNHQTCYIHPKQCPERRTVSHNQCLRAALILDL